MKQAAEEERGVKLFTEPAEYVEADGTMPGYWRVRAKIMKGKADG